MSARRAWRLTVVAILMVAPIAAHSRSPVHGGEPVDFGPRLDPARVEGHLKCIDCHRAEYLQWKQTKHGGGCFDTLRTTPRAAEYAQALGLDIANLTETGTCIQCHATPAVDDLGQPTLLTAVSCEACHNPSGGEDGWLNAHAVYGPDGRRQLEAAAHREARLRRTRTAQQLGSEETYEIVKRCAECHIPSIEELFDAGHRQTFVRFLVPANMLGKVRHNFHLDQNSNAEVSSLWLDSLWHGPGRTAANRKRLVRVLGALVDLEISLGNISRVRDVEGSFAGALESRVIEVVEFLIEDILDWDLDEVLDGEAEDEESDFPLIADVVSAATPIFAMLDEDGVAEFESEDLALCGTVAAKVQELAYAFAQRHRDGEALQELDEPARPDDY